jgi:Gemin6 protein
MANVGLGDESNASGLHGDWLRRHALVGKHVVVTTKAGGVHQGVLSAVDPETGSATVFASAKESVDSGDSQPAQLHVVLGHAIANVEACADPAPDALLKAYAAFDCAPVPESMLDAEALQKAQRDVMKLLQRVRIDAAVDESGHFISVMGGVARIVQPYGPKNCHGANETVLLRLRGILEIAGQIGVAERHRTGELSATSK